MIILGIVNGGLGYQLTGNRSAYIPYGVVAGIVFLIYVSVVLFAWYRGGAQKDTENEKTYQQGGGYEMQNPRQAKHTRLPSDNLPHNAYEQQTKNQGGVAVSYR